MTGTGTTERVRVRSALPGTLAFVGGLTLVFGIGLLFAYSLGIGLPFVLAGLGLVSFGGRLKRYATTIQLVGGVVLIGVGVLLLTGQLTQITIWMQRLLGDAHLDFWNF